MEQYTLCVYTSCICCTQSVPLLVAKKLVQCLKHLEMAWQVANLHWGFSISILVSCDCNLFTFWHCFLKYLIVDHIATVDSEFSQLWSMNSCLFDVVFELWYGSSFRSSSLPVPLQRLFDRVTQASLVLANRSVHWALSATHRSAESRSTPLITSLRLASRGSLYSPFSSPCCVDSHCSAFLFWYSLLGKSGFNQLREQRGNIVSRTNRAEFIYGIRPN